MSMQHLHASDGSSAGLRTDDTGELLELRDRRGHLIVEYDTQSGKAVLHLAGAQLAIQSAHGRIEFSSDQGMRLSTANTLELEAAQGVCLKGGVSQLSVSPEGIDAMSPKLQAHVEALSFEGERITARATEVQATWGKLEQVIGRSLTFAKNVYERIEGLWHSRAGRIRTEAQGTYLVQAKDATLASREDVHIQGKTIHMG